MGREGTSYETRLAKAREHLAAESDRDLDATIASMEAPYFYEIWPTGRRMEGEAAARAYYEFHFRTLRPRMVGAEAIGEYMSDEGLVLERDVFVANDNGNTDTHRVLAVIAVGERGVTGERIYASTDFHRLVFGALLDTHFSSLPGPNRVAAPLRADNGPGNGSV